MTTTMVAKSAPRSRNQPTPQSGDLVHCLTRNLRILVNDQGYIGDRLPLFIPSAGYMPDRLRSPGTGGVPSTALLPPSSPSWHHPCLRRSLRPRSPVPLSRSPGVKLSLHRPLPRHNRLSSPP